MMTPTDYEYYEWLISQIGIPNNKSYRDLFELMHNVEFHWTVPNDDNRVQDGLDLRREFLNGRNKKLNLPSATFLEVLVALSRRLEFIADDQARRWAWRLIKNLRLHKMSDPLMGEDLAKANDILFAVVWRTYREDGFGGFFPLNHPEEDQTKVEIWYQMNKYVIERNLL